MAKRAKASRMFAALVALGLASPALAGPGNGIRFGGSEGRLHPFLDLETRYDSNLYYNRDAASVGGNVLHFRPGFTLAVPGELTSVDLRGALDWAQYLSASDLSRLYGDASLGVGVNKRGAVGLDLTDAFRRTDQSDTLSLGSAVITNDNTFRLAVPWRPGGGALVFTAGGEWQLQSYEPYVDATGPNTLCDPLTMAQCDSSRLAKLGWNELRGTGELRWKFLPRTAYVVDGGYFSRLPNDTAFAPEQSGFRIATGLSGLVTSRLAATVKAGYGQTTGTFELRTWLANAEIEWLASETASARVGFVHDLGVDPGNVFTVFQGSRAYVDGRILVAGRFTGRLQASYERRGYESVDADATLLRVEPAVEAEVTRWFRLSLGYAYTDRTSTFPTGTPRLPGYDYSKNEIWLRSSFAY
jgi:hypothetical protein